MPIKSVFMLVNRKEILNEDQTTIGYIESIFKSENILRTTYFPDLKKLYISFGRGQTYSYFNIPLELYENFEKSESQGKFFHENIENNKAFPFRKEFTLIPIEMEDIRKIIESYGEDDNE